MFEFTAADDVAELPSGDFVEFAELFFLEIVVDGGYRDNDDDSNEDGGTFKPTFFDAVGETA